MTMLLHDDQTKICHKWVVAKWIRGPAPSYIQFTPVYTHSSDVFIMAAVTAHKEGSRSHEEVQHPTGQDRNIGMLP